MIQPIFTARFSGGQYCRPISQSWTDRVAGTYIEFVEKIVASSALHMYLLDFSYIASFRNRSALNSTKVEN